MHKQNRNTHLRFVELLTDGVWSGHELGARDGVWGFGRGERRLGLLPSTVDGSRRAFCRLPSMGAVEPSAVWPSRDAHTHHLSSRCGQLREGRGCGAGASGGRDGELAGGQGDGRCAGAGNLVASQSWLA
jgi:hypothetical protein